MARALSASSARFATAPQSQRRLYVVELSDGVVKVGRTYNPRSRLHTLEKLVRRHMGASLVRWQFAGHFANDRELCAAECLLVDRLSAVATALPGRIEFFDGLAFAHACSVLEQITQPVHSSVKSADPVSTL